MEDARMNAPLRLAVIADRQAIETIVAAAYGAYTARIGRDPGPMSDDYGALILQGRVHVVEAEGMVQGLLVLIPETDAMLLDNVAVAPSAQGRGFGRKLLEFAERTAADAGYRSIKLYTNEAMTENIALYCSIGYSETHRISEKGFRRVYMAKSLAAS
jgi:ribosomal protein S18 acetylase RimI-like enzyme